MAKPTPPSPIFRFCSKLYRVYWRYGYLSFYSLPPCRTPSFLPPSIKRPRRKNRIRARCQSSVVLAFHLKVAHSFFSVGRCSFTPWAEFVLALHPTPPSAVRPLFFANRLPSFWPFYPLKQSGRIPHVYFLELPIRCLLLTAACCSFMIYPLQSPLVLVSN